MSTTEMTPRQRQVYDLIAAGIAEEGFPPTMREMMGPLGITSPTGMLGHLNHADHAAELRRLDGLLASMIATGLGDSPEAEEVRDHMEAHWHKISEAGRETSRREWLVGTEELRP